MKNVFIYTSPIGSLEITDEDKKVISLHFSNKLPTKEELNPFQKEIARQLDEYFIGKRKEFHLALNPSGTDFQKKVWNALQTIPYGTTCSYKEIAQKIGNEKACRAVGMANNRNPIAIIIPCHRVIGCSGKLVGYAGGLKTKETLLSLEQKFI